MRHVGDPVSLAWVQAIRAATAWRTDDHATAASLLLECLRTFRYVRHLRGLSTGLLFAAFLAGTHGDPRQTATLLGASEELRQSLGVALLPFVATWFDAAIAQAHTVLGADAFHHAWRAGQAMTPDSAAVEALQQLDSTDRRTAWPGSLPARRHAGQ